MMARIYLLLTKYNENVLISKSKIVDRVTKLVQILQFTISIYFI